MNTKSWGRTQNRNFTVGANSVGAKLVSFCSNLHHYHK